MSYDLSGRKPETQVIFQKLATYITMENKPTQQYIRS